MKIAETAAIAAVSKLTESRFLRSCELRRIVCRSIDWLAFITGIQYVKQNLGRLPVRNILLGLGFIYNKK